MPKPVVHIKSYNFGAINEINRFTNRYSNN